MNVKSGEGWTREAQEIADAASAAVNNDNWNSTEGYMLVVNPEIGFFGFSILVVPFFLILAVS
jgi:hypothetical protein